MGRLALILAILQFGADNEDGVCYQVGKTPATYADASAMSEKFGSKLASVHNMQENAFIHDLAVNKSAVNVFLGAKATGPNKEFKWEDGTSFGYDNFFPGFPRKSSGNQAAIAYAWTPRRSRGSGSTLTAMRNSPQPIEDPVCTGEDYDEGQIITSPGFPFTSNTPCDYFLTVQTGKKVAAQIISLEANECCDTLFLNDGYFGGSLIAKLTGSIKNATYVTHTSNIMRVSWQPKAGGVDMMGLAMTYHAA